MVYPSELSDWRAEQPFDEGAMMDGQDEGIAERFNKIAALAYARWEALRDDEELPSIAHSTIEETRLFTSNCVQVAWDPEITLPTISYLGESLAPQLAEISGDHWPNLPIESPIVTLLHRISQQAVEERDATEFKECVTDSNGMTRECRGLALPFLGRERGTFLVDVMFDLDQPMEPLAQAEELGELLLEQELDPEEMPNLATKPPPPPVLFVCVSGDRDDAARPRSPRSSDVQAKPYLLPISAEIPAEDDIAQDEPLLLTESFEAPSADEGLLINYDEFLMSLEEARHQVEAASSSEERSHVALYRAIGAAYDFSIYALDAPDRLERMIVEAGLTMQARAPMTPIVKLVFGAHYDRPRLAEYATALAHGRRKGVAAGAFVDYLLTYEGGLKGIVKAERARKRKIRSPRHSKLELIESKLRQLPAVPAQTITPKGEEFALVLARRMPDGTIALLGEVPKDERLLCSAAQKFLKT
ncbi:hypothetical protein [Novosphingobium pentaromativorans]|uniref:Uncharacterized protein n=1 Tax=Novosphingobium pentaromativorans US6-1 TaxID=1088721 RepID=G6EED5_9SPHN|nr:hypothetical protein [Novosphingobium pentaromativorans]EHJ60358.1 hypothetical protein NSU_2706 [Novosphingobium pentaromativorans US6-1]